MSRRQITAAAMAVATVPLVVAAAPGAQAAEACVPTVTMDKPFQDVGGLVVFPASFTLCEGSRVTLKYRDRDDPAVAGSGYATYPAGPGMTWSGTCNPDSRQRRWVAYATVKTTTGTLLVKSAKAYFKAAPITRNCAPWTPPAGG